MMPTLSRSLVRTIRQRTKAGEALRAQSCLRIADSVGIALAAARSGDTAQQSIAGAGDGSAGGACSIFGSARREAPAAAAFANSALVHVLDFDDIHDAARLHPTTVTLPAALAAAQLAGARGEAVVDAVLLADELMCRLGVVCSPTGTGPGSDWFLTQLFGYFGAAAAAGSVLGLDEDTLVSAFGLAYMQAAGGKQAGFGTGSTARAIYPAFAAQGSVQACLLARAGIKGPEGAFDGLRGSSPSTSARSPLRRSWTCFRPRTGLKRRRSNSSPGPAAASRIRTWPRCWRFARHAARPSRNASRST